MSERMSTDAFQDHLQQEYQRARAFTSVSNRQRKLSPDTRCLNQGAAEQISLSLKIALSIPSTEERHKIIDSFKQIQLNDKSQMLEVEDVGSLIYIDIRARSKTRFKSLVNTVHQCQKEIKRGLGLQKSRPISELSPFTDYPVSKPRKSPHPFQKSYLPGSNQIVGTSPMISTTDKVSTQRKSVIEEHSVVIKTCKPTQAGERKLNFLCFQGQIKDQEASISLSPDIVSEQSILQAHNTPYLPKSYGSSFQLNVSSFGFKKALSYCSVVEEPKGFTLNQLEITNAPKSQKLSLLSSLAASLAKFNTNIRHGNVCPELIFALPSAPHNVCITGINHACHDSHRPYLQYANELYMAPEVARRNLKLDGDETKLADVFSFGIIGLELLSGINLIEALCESHPGFFQNITQMSR